MTASPAPRILVVEDEGITAWDIEHSLQDLGFVVIGIADSAAVAMDMARASRPDLILMDVHIKGPEDGITVARRIRDELALPVVYITAHRDRPTLDRAKATEPLAYLLKPFHRNELQTAVEVALHRHQLERALRRRERLLVTTLRCIRDGVVTTDPEGTVTLMNPAAEHLTGWSEGEARGTAFDGVVQLQDTWTGAPAGCGVDLALGGVEPLPVDTAWVVGRDGRRALVSAVAAPMVDGPDLLGAVAVMHDLDRERLLRQQLEHAERLAAFGTLAAGVAHEINNPLAFVVGNLHYAIEALTRVGIGSSDEIQALRDALEGAHRITRIVEDLRSFGRAPPATRTVVDLAEVIRYAVAVTETTRRGRCRIEVSLEGRPAVHGDEARLGQVLVNLLINAADATEEIGARTPIRVRAGEIAPGRVALEVEDSGVGMTPEALQRAFEPFFTTKPQGKGTGLGLSVAHGIVEAHGGTIEVRSAPGVGTTFRVLLPVHAAASATPAPPTAAHRGRILVIDDEPALLRSLQRVLQRHHDVTCAAGAEQALGLLRGGQRFDAVLCDVQMPGTSGVDLWNLLRVERPDMAARMTMISGGSVDLDRFGATPPRLLKKPFDPVEFLAIVDRLVAPDRQG